MELIFVQPISEACVSEAVQRTFLSRRSDASGMSMRPSCFNRRN